MAWGGGSKVLARRALGAHGKQLYQVRIRTRADSYATLFGANVQDSNESM
jgi:hypothetical protein